MAIPDEQIQDALNTNEAKIASTRPDVSENIQVAGKGKALLPIIDSLSKILKREEKGGVSGSVSGSDTTQRVPEPGTETLLKEGESYEDVQKKLTPGVLTEEGAERFSKAGFSAKAVNPEEDVIGIAKEAAETEATLNAKAAHRTNFRQGLTDEGNVKDYLEIKDKNLISGDTGLDFNFNNFDSGADVTKAINSISEIFADTQQVEKRGIKTNKETIDEASSLLADEIGFTKKLLNKKVGQLLNAEQMTAARYLLQKSAARLEELAKKIESGDASPNDMVAFRRQMSIHAGIQMKVKGAQTEIARALQSFKIQTGTNQPLVQAQVILDETGGTDLVQKMAKGYLDAVKEGGQANGNKYVAGAWYQKLGDVWQEVYINGLLSWAPTHLKNALATPLFMIYNSMADILAAGIGTTVRLGQKTLGKQVNPEGVFFEDIFARYYGYHKSLRDAYIVMAKTFKTGVPADVLNKIENSNYKAIDAETLNLSGDLGKAVDLLGKIIRYPGTALQAADDFWRVISSRGELYEQAVRQVRKSKALGKSNDDSVDDALMVLLDPKFKSDELDNAARYVTMTSDLGDGLLGGLTKNIRRGFIGKLLMPFAKAPTNSMLRVAEGHPLINAALLLTPSRSQVRDNILGKNGARIQQRTMGKMSLGAMTLSMFHEYALNGQLTGSYPRDKQAQKMLPPGWQPYSIVFRAEGFPTDEDGDVLPMYNRETGLPNGKLVYVSYQGLEPVSAFLGIAASTAQYQTMFYDPEDRMNLISASVLATYDYFRDLPFLQGLGSIARAIEYGDPGLIVDSPLGSMVGALPLPYSSAVRNISKLTKEEEGVDGQGTIIPRKTPAVPGQYYSIADVEKLFEDSKKTDNPFSEIPYGLVGTLKNIDGDSAAQFFYDNMAYGWNQQVMTLPYVKGVEEKFAYKYDMLGFKKERGVPFSVNPILAMWNSITPFRMSYGVEEIEPYHAELIRLGAPLTEEKKRMRGISLDDIRRGQLTEIAKNQVMLPLRIKGSLKGQGGYTFRDYLKILMINPEYVKANDDEKIQMIKNAERFFYEAALPILLASPGNEDLADAFRDESTVDQSIKILRGQ